MCEWRENVKNEARAAGAGYFITSRANGPIPVRREVTNSWALKTLSHAFLSFHPLNNVSTQ
jgi:hypothetical protein